MIDHFSEIQFECTEKWNQSMRQASDGCDFNIWLLTLEMMHVDQLAILSIDPW